MAKIIQTDRLVLRPLREDDLDALHAIFSNSEAMRFFDRPAWSDIAQTRRMLAHYMADAPDEHLEYAVDHNGACIGRVGMWKRYEVGYLFHPDTWGRGFGTEALGALVGALQDAFPAAEHLTAECDPRNRASCRVLEKCGFTLERIGEKDYLYGGSEWCDTAYYSRCMTKPQ